MKVNIVSSEIGIVRSLVETLLIVILTTFINFNKKVEEVEKKIDIFYKILESNGINFVLLDDVYLTFDYDYIDDLANTTFVGLEVEVEKVSSQSFNIVIFVEENFFNKKISETIYLQRGELND